jgi:hypothetical protein
MLLKVDKKGLRYYISGAFKVAGGDTTKLLNGLSKVIRSATKGDGQRPRGT